MEPQSVALDPTLRCADAVDFENEAKRRVMGQSEAVGKGTISYRLGLAVLPNNKALARARGTRRHSTHL